MQRDIAENLTCMPGFELGRLWHIEHASSIPVDGSGTHGLYEINRRAHGSSIPQVGAAAFASLLLCSDVDVAGAGAADNRAAAC